MLQENLNASDKIFYSISEVGQITDVPPYVLRYWEKEFKQLAPEKSSTGQRRYRKDDIETVQKIKKLLYEDLFTIEGAKKKLKAKREVRQLSFDLKENDASNLIYSLKQQLKSLRDILNHDPDRDA